MTGMFGQVKSIIILLINLLFKHKRTVPLELKPKKGVRRTVPLTLDFLWVLIV